MWPKELRSERLKFVMMITFTVVAFASFWYGLRAALTTEHPLLVVSSESMVPTLHVGDLIIVRGVNVNDIKAAPYPNGDIIVFRSPIDPNVLIVHRAVGKAYEDGEPTFITKGDRAFSPDPWRVKGEQVVGKVVFRIPLLGYATLFFQTPTGRAFLILLALIVLAWGFIESGASRRLRALSR